MGFGSRGGVAGQAAPKGIGEIASQSGSGAARPSARREKERPMITALNMTVPLKQDPESLAKLQKLKEMFADHIQPEIDRALRKSKIVHFARVLVIHDRFLQVITEFDGDTQEYT